MLGRPGELVTREELRQRLWPVGTFVDFEHSLNAAVKRLRAALELLKKAFAERDPALTNVGVDPALNHCGAITATSNCSHTSVFQLIAVSWCFYRRSAILPAPNFKQVWLEIHRAGGLL
jgi:hypothetical protein